jgi:DNA repair protein RecO (recombination protein O)
MHWTDEAIILSAKKHGENSAVVRAFVKSHGVFAGVAKGAHSKANRGVFQPGNVVSLTWSARLQEHIGTVKAELLTPGAALVMQDASKLAALSSACALMEASLPERHPYAKLYKSLWAFLQLLTQSDDWHADYVSLELSILAESGFGLDLTSCAATGTQEDLVYVSPKSGRAVSRAAGAPYKDKMLPLPDFLLASTVGNSVKPAEILDGLRLTGYFLHNWLIEPHGRKLPAARQRLLNLLKETHGENAC